MEEEQKTEVSEAQTTGASPDAAPQPGGPQAPQQPTPAASAPQPGTMPPAQGDTGQQPGEMPAEQQGMPQGTEGASEQQKNPEEQTTA